MCAVEWCTERARVKVKAGGQRAGWRARHRAPTRAYCKAHVRWFGSRNARSGVGFREGYFAARAKPEDFETARVRLCSFGEDGIMDKQCKHCGAFYFAVEGPRESFGVCCRRGKLKFIPKLPPAPQALAALFKGRGKLATAFKQDVRRYNGALAFASFTDARSDLPTERGGGSRGPPVYVLHGQAYHSISTLYPGDGRDPRFGQFYIFDPKEAAERRASAFGGLSPRLLLDLQRMLEEPVRREGENQRQPRNPYPQAFLHLHQRVQQEEARANARGEVPRQQVLRMTCAEVRDPRRYNKPTSREVAVVYVGQGPVPNSFVHVYPRRTAQALEGQAGGDTQRLSYLAEHTDPLTYPLIHTEGTLGWSTNLEYCQEHLARDAKRLRITLTEFYAHRLMTRELPNSGVVELPHAAGRLFQQYIVDAYTKLESTRLDWVIRNQDKLRVESLQGLADHVAGLDYTSSSAVAPGSGGRGAVAERSILAHLGALPAPVGFSSGARRESHQQATIIVFN